MEWSGAEETGEERRGEVGRVGEAVVHVKMISMIM